MKVIYKHPKDVSQKKKIVDIHKYARQKNRFFWLSLFINIVQLGVILAILHG